MLAKKWIDEAEAMCRSRGLQVTALRRAVMTIVAEAQTPVGAYAIIQRLSEVQGRSVAPTTVYRTLDFLVDSGIVVKIESRQAYVACDHLGHDHHGALLICTRCGASDEIEIGGVEKAVREAATATGFRPQQQVIEVMGLCAPCQAAKV